MEFRTALLIFAALSFVGFVLVWQRYLKLVVEYGAKELEVASLGAEISLLRQALKLQQRIKAFKKIEVQFSDEEIKRLLMLCHPDKHGGKQMAQDMTAKLLSLRAAKQE